MKFLTSLICAAAILPSVAQAEFRIRDYYVECAKSASYLPTITLKLNSLFRSISHVGPEVTDLEVLEWEPEFIRATTTMSYGDFTKTTFISDETEILLNRMNGNIEIAGYRPLSEEQEEECQLDGERNPFCLARLVVHRDYYECAETKPQF